MLLALLCLPTLHFYPALFNGQFQLNGEHSNIGYPLYDLLAKGLRRERSLLWSPDINGGHPIFAEGQGAFAYPLNLVFAWLYPGPHSYSLLQWIHLALGSVGMYLLGRHNRASREASFLAATASMFSPFCVTQSFPLCVSESLALSPWAIYAYERWDSRPTPRNAGILAAAIALLTLTGYPQFLHGTLIYIAILQIQRIAASPRLMRSREWIQPRLQTGIVAVTLATGASAVQWIPLLELTGLSHRSDGIELVDAIPLLDPTSSPEKMIGFLDLSLPLLFCSPLVLLLAWTGLTLSRNRNVTRHAIATSSFLVLVLGSATPIFRLIYEHHLIPGLNAFQLMLFYIPHLMIGISMLAGFGIDAVCAKETSGMLRQLAPHERLTGSNRSSHTRARFAIAATGIIVLVSVMALPAQTRNMLWAIPASLSAWFLLRNSASLRWALCAIVGAQVLANRPGQIAWADRSFLEASHGISKPGEARTRDGFRTYDASDSLTAANLPASAADLPERVELMFSTMAPMTNLLSNTSSLQSEIGLDLARYHIAESLLREQAGRLPQDSGHRLLDSLGVRHVFLHNRSMTPAPVPPISGLDPTIVQVENTSVRARIRLHAVAACTDSPETAMALREQLRTEILVIETENVRGTTRCLADPLERQRPEHRFRHRSTLAIVESKDDIHTIDVSGRKGSWLFIADAYYPGWRAHIDGTETAIYPADLLGKAVWVPKGKHRVTVSFRSSSFTFGLILSLTSSILGSILLAASPNRAHESSG